MIEVQCTSCHTRYRIDEKVLPEGLPTFKCSRCGHVFSFEPRQARFGGQSESAGPKAVNAPESTSDSSTRGTPSPEAQEPQPGMVARMSAAESPPSPRNSTAAGDSDIPDSTHADAAPSRFHSGQSDDDEPAKRREQRGPAASEPQRLMRAEPHLAGATAAPQPALARQLRAKQPEKFYSGLFTSNEPDAASGENLSFTFADEEPAAGPARITRRARSQDQATESTGRDSKRWEVGDDHSLPRATRSGEIDPPPEDELTATRRGMRASDTEPQFTDDGGFVDEEEAPMYNRAITHSARFFLLLIFLVGAGFGALTLLIHSSPAGWSVVLSYLPLVGDRFVIPVTPAKLVALHDVHAVYQLGKDGQNTLVISGSAENVGTASLRIVQLTAALRDAQRHSLASQAVYCGNSVSAGMIGQMTQHEIEFFQKLEPTTTFALEPSANCRFVAVFVNPPNAAHAYDVSVSQAVSGNAPGVEEPAS
jgi:predicted Zn finger-like uncharacterized protein